MTATKPATKPAAKAAGKPVTAKPATAWKQVSKQIDTLGADLRHRFDALGSDATDERKALERSVRGVTRMIDDLRVSTGKAIHDAALRKDVAGLAAALRDALTTTAANAGKTTRAKASAKAKDLTGRGKAAAHKAAAHKAEEPKPAKAPAKKAARSAAGRTTTKG